MNEQRSEYLDEELECGLPRVRKLVLGESDVYAPTTNFEIPELPGPIGSQHFPEQMQRT